jgi:CYTH domain-containing protein
MAIEIERKFKVIGEFKSSAYASHRIIQGYLCTYPDRTVRVRIYGKKAFLTIKGKSTVSMLSRFEWEKEIPVEEAKDLLLLCKEGIIDKTRYLINVGRHIFEVDEFYGDNEGLILAEVELKEDNEVFEKPKFIGEEVTDDVRYYNAHLLHYPFKEWKE